MIHRRKLRQLSRISGRFLREQLLKQRDAVEQLIGAAVHRASNACQHHAEYRRDHGPDRADNGYGKLSRQCDLRDVALYAQKWLVPASRPDDVVDVIDLDLIHGQGSGGNRG